MTPLSLISTILLKTNTRLQTAKTASLVPEDFMLDAAYRFVFDPLPPQLQAHLTTGAAQNSNSNGGGDANGQGKGGSSSTSSSSSSSSSSTSVVPKKVKMSAEELERLRLGRHWHGRLGTHLGDAVRSFARATRLSV